MAEEQDTPPPAKLRLRPFAAMRYDADAVGDIGEVTSPPYDVMDRPMIEQLLEEHPHNIVRLILPRMVGDPVGTDNPYVKAAKRMRRWRSKGVLRTDPEPALYVYEYGDDQHRVCGLVGALELRKPHDQVVLPHEDVIPGIVADRLAGMSTARANLEPILLVYDGQRATSDLIADARSRPALTDVHAPDGSVHRLWAITDREQLGEIRRLLAPHQALIADGHHRYATYLQLRRRHRSIGDGPGPWDRGLALLIDQSEFPLQLGAIHRSASELDLAQLAAPREFTISEPEPVGAAIPMPSARAGGVVLTDGRQQREVLLVGERENAVTDAELVHTRLLPAWGVTEDRIGYHHTIEQTLSAAHREGGVAILLRPTSVTEVMAVARAGKVMPRKSTSFGPKPRMGLVMRSFDDEI
ncbi:MAG: DUF1015 family protein [Nocardioidaceae bacterium]